MKQALSRQVAAAATVLFLATGCSSAEVVPETSTPAVQVQADSPTEITVWVSEAQALGLEVVAAQFLMDTGTRVSLVVKENLQPDFLGAGTGTGPDIILGSYDWQPELVTAGKLEPIDVSGVAEAFIPGAIQAFAYQGQQYGLPVSQENAALACVLEAMPTAPESFQEVVAAGLAISLNDGTGDPYHFYALQTSFGAPVFETAEDGSYLPVLGMGGEAGFAFAAWLSDNATSFELASNTRNIKEELVAGTKACWLTGPWNGNWFNEQFGESGWAAYPVPPAGPYPASTFSGATGAMVASGSDAVATATKFVLEYLGSSQGQLALFQGTGKAPAELAALEQSSASKIAYEFGMAGLESVPMPVIAEMDSIWVPWAAAQVGIIRGDDEPAVIWQKMLDEINASLGY